MCVQVTKLFLAEEAPDKENNLLRTNFTANEEFTSHAYPNTTAMQTTFQSDVENVFFIFGGLSIVGTALQIVCWLHSGCKWSHRVQVTEAEVQSPSSGGGLLHGNNKQILLIALFLLCLTALIGKAIDENFASLIITFAVNTLDWKKSDASNLATLFWASFVMSRCVSVLLAKFLQAEKLMILCAFVGFGGTLFMTFTLTATQLSLWVGVLFLGLGIGNVIPNTLNAGKRLTSQTGVFSSFILANAYTGKIVAPLLVGYLFDNVDPMWFLYLGVVYSSGLVVLSVVFQILLKCCVQPVPGPQQECDVPLDAIETPEETPKE